MDIRARGLQQAMGVPVVVVSALAGEGLAGLDPWLGPGQTVALLGCSGVGKSTLINALLGAERQATGEVREHDSRGRHTTTHRELMPLPGGAVLLDTPGMRELQLWGDETSVGAAIAAGALDAERLKSWRKLQRELRRLARRQDARARSQEQARWKQISKSMKHHPKADRWR